MVFGCFSGEFMTEGVVFGGEFIVDPGGTE